jgi:mRNA interferase MazF
VTNGLRKRSQVMIDRAIALPRSKVGQAFGHLDDADMLAVNLAIYRFFGLRGIGPD